VTLHYQWMIRHDYLPRICDDAVVDDVFTNGRKLVEADAGPTDIPTMPVEFSVAAFRLGHSMIRPAYNWNRIFSGRGGALFGEEAEGAFFLLRVVQAEYGVEAVEQAS